MLYDALKVILITFYCVAGSIFVFIVLYVAFAWCKYLIQKYFTFVFKNRDFESKKQRVKKKEQLINNYLDNL